MCIIELEMQPRLCALNTEIHDLLIVFILVVAHIGACAIWRIVFPMLGSSWASFIPGPQMFSPRPRIMAWTVRLGTYGMSEACSGLRPMRGNFSDVTEADGARLVSRPPRPRGGYLMTGTVIGCTKTCTKED